MKKTKQNKIQQKNNNFKSITILFAVLILAIFANDVSASLKLDSIQFDPAIIAAGDEVDIVVQYHHDIIAEEEDRISNKDYKFKVVLEPDDALTEDYVIIQDAVGDDLHGSVFSGDYYNKRFRVKVNNNAPSGNYEFKLSGRWYYQGSPEPAEQYIRFKMPVKKEGIIMDVTTLETTPSEVRPGDNYVKIVADVTNVGEKDAKSVEIKLDLPETLKSSYTNDNRIWIGRLNSGESKEATFFVDVDDLAEDGVYTINYLLDFMDLDDNRYQNVLDIPFLVKPRPYLEIDSYKGEGLAGSMSKLYVTVKNTGGESAEAVDVRILKQNSQPFVLDVRSDYIGELEPGETGVAVFEINVQSHAEVKEHDLKLLIRSKGDSDEGDDNIYTYNRRAKFAVTGNAPNYLLYIGAGVLVVILLVYFAYKGRRKR